MPLGVRSGSDVRSHIRCNCERSALTGFCGPQIVWDLSIPLRLLLAQHLSILSSQQPPPSSHLSSPILPLTRTSHWRKYSVHGHLASGKPFFKICFTLRIFVYCKSSQTALYEAYAATRSLIANFEDYNRIWVHDATTFEEPRRLQCGFLLA